MDAPIRQIEDGLSIVNHPATRLKGPNLLHFLVQNTSQDGQAAIDFLKADGRRISLSYAEFHHESDALALRISALAGTSVHAKPFVVPVLMPQSPELYVALLAILKAGGAFCPMNLDVPLNRAKFILEDVAARVVITTSDLASKLPEGDHSVLIIDGENSNDPPATITHRQPTPDDLAYVMYTSGSTGTPKGVGVSHDAVTQSLLAHDRHIPQFSRFLQFAAPTFDVSVFETFFPFFRGKTLVSCTRPAMLNDLPGVIQKLSVDACELTPSVAGSLLRARENAPGLRLLLTIGEMLTQPVVEEFGGNEDRPSMLWGMYGPTEAAIHCTLQPAFARDSAVRNIGIQLDTVSAFILKIPKEGISNPEFTVLPRGEVGELAVGGYQLAEGYLNRPEQTAAAFIDTPYGRIYRTGDKARMLLDGTLECLGRIADGQVKLRGQRMELGEVEHAALRTPGCHSAVAAVTDVTLVLFCAVDGTGDMAGAIMGSCREWLPGFMLPGDIVVVQSFPRLASGKVDRKRLIAEYTARTTETPHGISYEDETEERLCNLTSGCLGLKVDPKQDLSKAGLDSLSAIKLASVLRDAGFEVGVIEVLEDRTISAIYKGIRSKAKSKEPESVSKAVDPGLVISDIVANHSVLSEHGRAIETVMPCTPLQASMLAETMADSRAYCNWVELKVAGTHSEESIRSWFLQLAQVNEILRTGFIHHNGQFLQAIFEHLPESRISITDSIIRDFELREDADFLCPFRVQFSSPPDCGETRALLQIHHSVYDGWSLDLMLSDLTNLVQGGQLDSRPQFSQITAYHRSPAFTDSCDAAREFWAGNLLGFQPPALPILTPETDNGPSALSSAISLDINPDMLKTTLQTIDCGPQTIFQAALAWIWSSMVGTEDVVVGMIQSGRTMPLSRVEDIVGPCIASVPLRTNLSQVQTIRDLLVSVHAGNRATLSHGVLPLAEIKRAACTPAGQSIYHVLFIYQESLHSKGRSIDAVRQVAHQDYLETKLLVEVEPRDKDFACRFTYHSDVFPESQILLIADMIRALIPYILKNLDSELPSLWTAAPQHLLSSFNQNPKTFSGVPDLATAVERITANFPNKDAVCFADSTSDGTITTTTITFAELDKTANRIAWHLNQQGVREGAVVAIIMEKSIRLYAGLLAILKTGCAYLPLLPSTPVARIETIFQQAQVSVCVVDTATQDKLQARLPCNLINLQSLDLRQTPSLSVKPQLNPERLAYIIYTSGSTGVPKGVCLTQLNIMSNLDVLSRIYPAKDASRLLQSCSQAFDVSVFEIFFAWTQGMCLCSGTNDTLFEDLERAIRKLNVTHLSMTPTVASLVDPAKVPRVEFLVTAGEPMTEAVAQRWGDKLYQGYGPSETTNICSVKKMGPNQAIQHLGWSVENTSTFVMTQKGTELVPFGCLGEFCFGGDQVARGYLYMEELTAAKFINHPTFGRIYRSGDLGRMLPDGSMVIVGRADEQIKIRGQRVELDEITEAIRQSGTAVCTTLFLRAAETGAKDQIISFVVLRGDEAVKFQLVDVDDNVKEEIKSLYQALESRLPAYMLPSAIIPISALPTTASGKLDRARLKQAFKDFGNDQLALVSHGADHNVNDGEWSAIEVQVAEAISSALNVSRADIQRWTPLATLGLDSISAIQVSRHLHTKLHTRFPISAILQNSTVARLARLLPDMNIQDQGQKQTSELLPKHVTDEVAEQLARLGKPFTKTLPCTPLQEAMLATSSGKGQYLNRLLFKINGNLEKVREAWEAMVVRHDILRTCFVGTNNAQWPMLQVVLNPWQAPWNEFDGSQCSFEECISQQTQAVPNVIDSLEPAVSFATFRQDDSVYLSFICHHALYDGVAIERLLYEVEQHSFGSSLPPAPAYDQFLRESLRLPPSTDSFWHEHLANYEPKLTSYLTTKLSRARADVLNYELDVPLSEVKTRTRELGVSLLALTQTAWATALSCIFKTNDVCFGNVVNGRSPAIPGIEDLVAPCFNTIPIRMDLTRRQRNLDLTKAFQSTNAELMKYQFTPLRCIQSLFSQHDNRRLFDTLLLLQQSPRPLDQSLWTLERDDGEMDVPLVCEVIPDGNLDRLIVKMHTVESPSLHGIVELAYDLFSHAFRNCLQFPGSRTAHAGGPRGLEERLSQVEHRPPHPTFATAQQEVMDEDWTTTESSVRAVLATLAPRASDHIRRDTTIYQLGLDSISAVQVASMLRKGGFQVAASEVIEHPTCARLARHIDTRTPDSGATVAYDTARFQAQIEPQILAHGIARDTVEDVLPCTPVQSAIMAQFIKSGGRDYFNFVDFELEDGLKAQQLAAAWQAVSRAHPILRTAIVPVEHDDCAFAMVQYHADLSGSPGTTLSQSSADSFNLQDWRLNARHAASKLPPCHRRLWSVAVVEVEARTKMHLAIHHALYDAHSLQVILDDLTRATMGARLPRRVPTQEAAADILGSFWKQQAEKVTTREVLTKSTTSTASLVTLEDAASKSGHTLQAILQAAWTRVLSAYLGENSVVFGVVLSGRNTETTRNAVFPCITTLPALLEHMLQYNTELYKQQHQPLARIQRWLGCPDSKLFDTLLVYQKLDRGTPAERPWSIVEPRAGGPLGYQITFFSDVLAREQALLLLRQFDAAERDLFRSCPDLFSVLPPETSEIPTEVQFLHQFVEPLHFVERFEGDVPVGGQWTYKELDNNGNQVAHMLLPYVTPGDIVAVYFDKCPEAYCSILGILKAGCAFFILQDSCASALVTSRQMKDNLQLTITVPVVATDAVSLPSAPADPPILSRELQPTDVCYCLYTSGTTGTPKGCEITHDNAVQCMLAFQHIFEGHWQEDSRWLQFASLHFDVSVLEQYWSWSVGIALVAAPRDLILEDLAGTISRLEITHIDLTPSLARLLHPDDVPSLCRGVFITGGESLKQEILDVWGSKGVIYNFYGPTEATIGVTVFPRVPTTGRTSNIGKQFINVGSYVMKPGTEQPVLRGGVGELCVSGRLVGKGYLKREDLTSDRFPTLQHFGERVYRTGDLVRVLHDGCFDFLGRADDQVKLRGQRLEIGEINHAIRKGVEAIQDVATLVVRNEVQQKDLLVSFITADDGAKRRDSGAPLEIVNSPGAVKLCQRARDACRSKLPGYMVPTYILQVPFIPLSANNKAETKQLRQFFAFLGQEELASLSPSPGGSRRALSDTGVRIAAVLATMQHENIDVSSVAPESSIFELGIDSITVLRFSRALKNARFAQASPSLILRHPLIGDLAAALEAHDPISNTQSAAAARQLVQACAHKHRPLVCRELGVTPDQIEYIAPCSPLQQGMISRSATDSAYFNTFQFILLQEVSADRLHDAFQRTLDALPILRTKFVGTTDGVVQVAITRFPLPWSDIHLEGKTPTKAVIQKTRDAWVVRNQERLAHPLEAVLINKEGARLLILHIFHGLYDANSLKLVLDRVATEYLTLSRESALGTTPIIPRQPSFVDAMCHGPLQDFSNSKLFWREHLEGATPHSPKRSNPSRAISSRLKVSFQRLEVLKTGLGVTHQALVQAAWVSVLAKHVSADPTIGVIVSGRNIELDGAEAVVGPLFNTLPFHARITAEGGTTWSSLVRQCHHFNTAALPFQHVPLRDIQKWCSGGKPLFDTLFSFQRDENSVVEHGNLWTAVDSEPNADFPLALEATLGSDGDLQLLIVAQQEDATRVSAMMADLEQALGSMAETPDDLVMCPRPGSSHSAAGDKVQNSDTANGVTTNGHHSPSAAAELSFGWSEDALVIRNEIAALAHTDPESITETTPLFGLVLKKQGLQVRTSELMKAQTIMTITELLQARTHNTETNAIEHASAAQGMAQITTTLRQHVNKRVELGADEVVLPATPLQESMVVEMIESDFQLYFNHDILELGPSVDLIKLKRAWRTVIAGSPILRTRFMPIESPSNDSSVYMADVSLDATDELAKICHTATLRAHKGAGLQSFLVLSIAHPLYDGWSLSLLHQDVQAAYEGTYQAQSLESYTSHLGSILFPEHRDAPAFWAGFLQDVTPTTFPEAPSSSEQGQLVHRDQLVSSLPASGITAFCKARAVTLQTLGQACWASLLAAKTGSLDSLEGFMSDNMSTIGAYQHFPLREAQKLAKSNGPLFNTLFIQQRGLPAPNQQGSIPLMKSVGGTSAVEYPVLVWRMACDGAYASQSKTSQMLRELDQVLGRMIRSPEASVLAFSGQQASICGQAPVMLHAPDSTPETATNGSVALNTDSWSPLEETIRNILAEVSGVPTGAILKSNNIYHLGLDSISAIKAGSLLRKNGVTIGFRDMLKAGSILEMAQLVREAQPVSRVTEATNGDGPTDGLAVSSDVDFLAILRDNGIDASTVADAFPATSMQVHMLSVWQNTLGEVFYPCFKYTMSGQIDSNTISTAWKALVAETPILRTVFVSTDSRSTPIFQAVLHSTAFDQGRTSVNDTIWDSKTTGDSSQPYNSLHAKKDGDKWSLQLKIHHALYDAVSLLVMMDRFAALCCTKDAEGPVFNWRSVLAAHHSEESRVARQKFWAEYLAGAQPEPLCFQNEAQDAKSRLQALFFAAYAEFLASAAVKNGRQRPKSVLFGVYLANRAGHDEPGASAYPFLRLVPLRVVLTEGEGLLGSAAEIQRDILAISSPVNVEVGLWEIQDWTGVTVDSFVNFLLAPAPTRHQKEKNVRLEVLEAAADDSAAHDNLTGEPKDEGHEIASNPVRDVFPNAIDVEASVQDDGMTIGVFGPGQRLGEDGAGRVITGVVELLMGLRLIQVCPKAKITVQTLGRQLVIPRAQP
ncbi:hypothetical protein C8A01DRAFT_47846 [Parachaetomium inaequale]|uniref:Carrier domain-containing protein n=1 Tax=Parachaetomium inaequale TaxID=2588326 RepID=A0AAN6SPT7_9PEZI|nr:hypothetical protein C8A01DRAFT_47846 [Parachaetomium inaequale]